MVYPGRPRPVNFPEPLEGTTVVWVGQDVRRGGSRRVYEAVKRQFDLIGALFLLLLASPLLVMGALAIRLSTPGPILFRHPRLGRHGHVFTLYKFRTMRWDAGAAESTTGSTYVVDGSYRKPINDSAVTAVGVYLRRWSIDELPNLLNVLLGEMSLVGPRPTGWSPDVYGADHHEILSVPPGVTGLWQVRGRGDLTFAERVTLDLEYVRRRSLAFDLWIFIKTVPAVVSRRGAY